MNVLIIVLITIGIMSIITDYMSGDNECKSEKKKIYYKYVMNDELDVQFSEKGNKPSEIYSAMFN